jgi:Tol biopolymer transport system component
VRELGESEARPLAGTENAVFPFWSADSQHIAFFADAMLRRVPRGGGPVQTICPAEDGRGGAWNGEGTIVFAADFRNAPLLQVSASGGEPTPVTRLDVDKGEVSHRFPAFLPNGRDFVFSVEPRSDVGRIQVKLGSLDAMSMGKPLFEATTAPRFAPPNQLVFSRDGALMAQSIDLGRLEMVGDAQLIDDRPSLLQIVTSTPVAHVAENGAMLYAPVDPRPVDFLWLDRDGRRSDSLVRMEGRLRSPAVSHSGDRVVVTRGTSFEDGVLWIYDLVHGEGSQVTPRNRNVFDAVWSSDDRDLVGLMSPGSGFAPVWIEPESGSMQNILEPALRWTRPTDVSADGSVMLYDDQTPGMKQNLGYLRLDSDAPERTNYLTTPAVEWGGKLSPDGDYIAYTSDATGSFEVYVDTFPTPTRANRVTTGGAALQVEFRSDGAELFILAADGDRASLYACAFNSEAGLDIGRPEKLFTLPVDWMGFAPSPDGDRFLLIEPVGNRSPTLTLVNNWQAQLAP